MRAFTCECPVLIIFRALLHWLYYGELINEKGKGGSALAWYDLYHLHVLARRYIFPVLIIETFEAFHAKLIRRLPPHKPLIDNRWLVTQEAVMSLGMKHPWVRLLVHYYAQFVSNPKVDEAFQTALQSEFPQWVPEFLSKVLLAKQRGKTVKPCEYYFKKLL